MRRTESGSVATLVLLVMLMSLGSSGCGQPVREDRSINWSQEGQRVGFQHGKEGVFLADQQGNKLRKIFQPGDGVLATSTPLWSPDGRKVIFTTARDAGNDPVPFQVLPNVDDPAGNVYLKRPIIYTCWLHEETGQSPTQEPVPLFEAACDHVGYVAANLAVRWHPRKQSLYYIQKAGADQHGLFEFDLTTKQSQQVFAHTAEALIFDWTPDGSRLVCVLGNTQQKPDSDGIWIGQPGSKDWWHVPQSESLTEGELPSLLEKVRATRPAWTADSGKFVFASSIPGKAQEQPARFFLRLGTLAARQVKSLAEGAEPFRDLRWAADGVRLGLVKGKETGSLHLLGPGEILSGPISERPVRHFAGWNASGDCLAYIVPDTIPLIKDDLWAFLFTPDPLARDAVYVADGGGKKPAREVFSRMRVTFPQWSPKENKLSLWVTFSPTFRSVVSRLLGWGLRPGDPAAIFEPQTGKLSWMAVNPHEQAQVGHYYLLKRNYAESLRWYTAAESRLPAAKPETARSFLEMLRTPAGARDFRFFQSYCLKKLGRKGDAEAKLHLFNEAFFPRSASGQPSTQAAGNGLFAGAQINGKTAEEWLQEWLDPKGLPGALVRDLYEAEVFLSLDAAQDAEEFFREALVSVNTDPARLSSALVLAQMLLLEQKYQAYADLTADTIGPLLIRLEKSRPSAPGQEFFDLQWVNDLASMLSLLPMCAPEFLARLPDAQIHTIAARWEPLREKATTDQARYQIDLILAAAYKRLDRDKEYRETAERLRTTNAAAQRFLSSTDISEAVKSLRRDWIPQWAR